MHCHSNFSKKEEQIPNDLLFGMSTGPLEEGDVYFQRGLLILPQVLTKFGSFSSLHWLVLVFFYALFVQWSIIAIESFKERKRERVWDKTNTFLLCA